MHSTLDSEVCKVATLWDDISHNIRSELDYLLDNHYKHWFNSFCPDSKIFEFKENLKLVSVIYSWLDEVDRSINIEELLNSNFDLEDKLDMWVGLSINHNKNLDKNNNDIFRKTFVNKKPLSKYFVLPALPWSSELLDKLHLFWGLVAKIIILGNNLLQVSIINNVFNHSDLELDSNSKINSIELKKSESVGSTADKSMALSNIISNLDFFITNKTREHYHKFIFQSIRLQEIYNFLTFFALDTSPFLKDKKSYRVVNGSIIPRLTEGWIEAFKDPSKHKGFAASDFIKVLKLNLPEFYIKKINSMPTNYFTHLGSRLELRIVKFIFEIADILAIYDSNQELNKALLLDQLASIKLELNSFFNRYKISREEEKNNIFLSISNFFKLRNVAENNIECIQDN